MKRLLVLLLLLMVQLVSADFVYDSKELQVKLDLSSSVTLVPGSTDYIIEYLTTNLTFFPKNFQMFNWYLKSAIENNLACISSFLFMINLQCVHRILQK